MLTAAEGTAEVRVASRGCNCGIYLPRVATPPGFDLEDPHEEGTRRCADGNGIRAHGAGAPPCWRAGRSSCHADHDVSGASGRVEGDAPRPDHHDATQRQHRRTNDTATTEIGRASCR